MASPLERFGTWMYRFELPDGSVTPLHQSFLEDVHKTRAAMIFPLLDQLVPDWSAVRCLDIACNEGFFSFEIAKRGAREVVGFDAHPAVIEKAEYIRSAKQHTNVAFSVFDLEQLGPEWKGRFEVVLCLGIVYHLENPIGCLRRVRSVTDKVCVIDTQLNRFSGEMETPEGRATSVQRRPSAMSLVDEPGGELSGVQPVSLVPNHRAMLRILEAVGFSRVLQMMPPADAYEQYANFDRAIYFAFP
jgi:SAM-dependent methyltransferase